MRCTLSTTLLILTVALGGRPDAIEAQASADSGGAGRGATEHEKVPALDEGGAADRPQGEGIRLTRPGDPPTVVTVGDAELRSLAGRLEAFGSELPLGEKLMMDWLLQRAAAAPADDPGGTYIEGSLFTPPLVMAEAVAPADSAADAGQAGATPPTGGEGANPADEAQGRTLAITPNPVAALSRALGMKLIAVEPTGGAPRPTQPPAAPETGAASTGGPHPEASAGGKR
ncbi:MAG: hypothetical protein H0V09_04060 [Gemmatimonadetes bacterium]|nr:hypothetical protein [Gemmatimonadota bacterium]